VVLHVCEQNNLSDELFRLGQVFFIKIRKYLAILHQLKSGGEVMVLKNRALILEFEGYIGASCLFKAVVEASVSYIMADSGDK
jgi:hypothetical protein